MIGICMKAKLQEAHLSTTRLLQKSIPPFDLAPSAKIFSDGDTQMSKHEKSSSRCYKSTMNRHALKSLKIVQEKQPQNT
jgi:hypothetical protein